MNDDNNNHECGFFSCACVWWCSGWSETVMGRRILQKLIKRMTKRLRRIQLAEKEQQAGKAVDALLDEVRQPNPTPTLT